MMRTLREQLDSLDSFQRAEFLRRRRTYEVIRGKIMQLRKETGQLEALLYDYRNSRGKHAVITNVIWVAAIIANITLNILPWVLFLVLLTLYFVIIFQMRNELISFEFNCVVRHEINRVESDHQLEYLRSIGFEDMDLSTSFDEPENDEVTKTILSSLGFQNGSDLDLNISPLNPQI